MKKYNRKLILDYVVGNDISDYDVNVLENDIDFMIQVIEFTKDKRVYNLCSDEIKYNKEFIMTIIDIFSMHDFNFVLKVVDNYLKYINYNTLDIDPFEILIVTHEKIKNSHLDDNDNSSLKLLIGSLVNLNYETITKKAQNVIINNQYNTRYNKEYIGKGFLYIENKYETSKLIKNYIAEKMVFEIFSEIDNLEKDIHKRCKNVLLNKDANLYIINYLYDVDVSLAKYVACNINIISFLKKKVDTIFNNWDVYNYNEMLDIIDYISYSYYNYLLPGISEKKVFKHIAKKLNISNLYQTYLNFIYEEDNNEEDIKINKLDKESIEWLNNLVKKVGLILNNGYEDEYVSSMKKEDSKNNIIEFKEKKKDNKYLLY